MNNRNHAILRNQVSSYEKSNFKISVGQLLNTFLPFILLWVFAYLSLEISYWLSLGLAILASGFLVRIFIIFHDCCHQSFFKSRKANDILGTISGIIALFPYEQWKRSHSIHHATSGNLNKRGIGDIWVLTVEEYVSAPFWKKIQYRLYRNPLIMFALGPFYLFLIFNRLNRKDARTKERVNTYITNASIVALYTGLCLVVGWQAFLLIQLPIMFVSGSLGIWLFYVQHHFEGVYFEEEKKWDFVKAAIDGSSYFKLPKVLQWLTGNIGFHHVHHLCPKVPNYNLEVVHDCTPAFQEATTITLVSSLKALRFRLWDESSKTFVSFQEIKPLLKQSHILKKQPSFQEK